MKRLLFLTLIFMLAITVLASCGDKPNDSDSQSSDNQNNNGICLHEWDRVISDDLIQKPATCKSKAVYYSKCKLCGVNGSTYEYGSVSDHSYTENVSSKMLVSAATCSARAVYYKSCEFCEKQSTETFEHGGLNSHNMKNTASADTLAERSNCEHPNRYYYSCSVCGELSTEVFEFGPVRPHNDKHGDDICDSCGLAMKAWPDDPSVDNITDKHEFGSN
jgi:hypothetical protein